MRPVSCLLWASRPCSRGLVRGWRAEITASVHELPDFLGRCNSDFVAAARRMHFLPNFALVYILYIVLLVKYKEENLKSLLCSALFHQEKARNPVACISMRVSE